MQPTLQLNDIVTARIQVKSDATNGKVAKLLYQSCGPFSIIEVSGHGSYTVQKLNKPDAPKLKFHGSNLFLLPPMVHPCEPLDTPDLRYINQSASPVPHPLQSALDIQLYNE